MSTRRSRSAIPAGAPDGDHARSVPDRARRASEATGRRSAGRRTSGARRTRPAPTRAGLPRRRDSAPSEGYKWVALFISTLGMLMATIDASITLIALPDIFRGIRIDPLQPANSFYLLWMILGFLVVTSVLVTTLGRLGDIYGRVRTYNLGFAVFTFFSLVLAVTWTTGHAAGIWLIVMRLFQAVG